MQTIMIVDVSYRIFVANDLFLHAYIFARLKDFHGQVRVAMNANGRHSLTYELQKNAVMYEEK
jgi:hypothetical protein